MAALRWLGNGAQGGEAGIPWVNGKLGRQAVSECREATGDGLVSEMPGWNARRADREQKGGLWRQWEEGSERGWARVAIFTGVAKWRHGQAPDGMDGADDGEEGESWRCHASGDGAAWLQHGQRAATSQVSAARVDAATAEAGLWIGSTEGTDAG